MTAVLFFPGNTPLPAQGSCLQAEARTGSTPSHHTGAPPGRQGSARQDRLWRRGCASPGWREVAAAQKERPFPPCCGAQSLCGAGPGLGLDRTVPGTMVSTGSAGRPRLEDVLPAVTRPLCSSARADGVGLAQARRRLRLFQHGNGCH